MVQIRQRHLFFINVLTQSRNQRFAGRENFSASKSLISGRGPADGRVIRTHAPTIQAVGNCYMNLEAPSSRVAPEPGLQLHANLKVGLRHVLSTPLPEERDLRLLRKALFPGRY
jgi:hypothetical protein